MAFIQTFTFEEEMPVIINTDNISAILKSETGCVIYTVSGSCFDVKAGFEEVRDLLTVETRKAIKIDTGVVNVKVVNPH